MTFTKTPIFSLKILQIVPSYKPAYIYGGPIESVARLCEELVRLGHTVHVYTTTANGKEELPVNPNTAQLVDGVPVTYFKRITKDPTHVSPALWKRLWKDVSHYDVVHIHSWWNILVIVAAFICYHKQVKFVLSPRGMLSDYILNGRNSFPKKWFHSLYGKRLLRQSFFHATSPAEEQECRMLIAGWEGFMLPNIIWLPVLQPVQKQNEHFTILFLSRIHPKKGIELLLKAIAVADAGICLKIVGTGDNAYLHQLKQLIKQLRIEHAVEWLGWKDRMEKFEELQRADLFALLSFNENFANAVVESLHAGTPVLVSDQVGLAPYIQQEKLGWVTTLEEQAIVKQIHRIKADITMREQVHKLASLKVAQSFSASVLIRQYIQEYKVIANKSV